MKHGTLRQMFFFYENALEQISLLYFLVLSIFLGLVRSKFESASIRRYMRREHLANLAWSKRFIYNRSLNR